MFKRFLIVGFLFLGGSLVFGDLPLWEQAYSQACHKNPTACSDSEIQFTGKFLDFARYDFVPQSDKRISEQREIWKSANRKPTAAAVPAPPALAPAVVKPVSKLVPPMKIKKSTNPKRIHKLLKQARDASRDGRYEEAEKALMRAQALDPESQEIKRELTLLEQLMGR
jgi:hypothetical protein